jgi:ABC-type phosphate/phosphonate transport system substrate-binding protein
MWGFMRLGIALVYIFSFLWPIPVNANQGNAGSSNEAPKFLHIVFTSAMVSEMNSNDAAAAVQVFGQQIAKRRKIPIQPHVMICNQFDDLQKLIRNEEADLVALRIDEYLQLESRNQFQLGFIGVRNNSWAEQYVLLTHNANGFHNIADLKGKRLILHSGRRMGLATEWLNILLRDSNLTEASEFFGQIRTSTKISSAVLPAFFKQVEACLVTQSGFETMSEMNPQLGKQLTAIKVSPSLLPSLICVRGNLPLLHKEEIRQALLDLQIEASGQQVLALFSLDKLIPLTPSHIAGAIEIYDKHKRGLKKTALNANQN